MESKGKLHITTKKNGTFVEINISDSGKGIGEEEFKRLGTPFYTTKDTCTGLGTMACYKIVDSLKREVHVKSKLNIGTTHYLIKSLLV
ncbi:ATP-binding protein [Evansella sp. AB-P1]|nr:ATP-binding protein [Evansella sp. AB-P1]MDG5789092.1 ATP-binding protein [Evansella sp. AB-P1]